LVTTEALTTILEAKVRLLGAEGGTHLDGHLVVALEARIEETLGRLKKAALASEGVIADSKGRAMRQSSNGIGEKQG